MGIGRSSNSILVLACGLLLAGAGPTAATLRDVALKFDPAVPTWRDLVTLEVRGEADCVVEISSVARKFEAGTGPVIQVEFDEFCILDPPTFFPFQLTSVLGRLEPAAYTVRLTPVGGGTPVAEAVLPVYEQADLEIALPDEVPTDAAPFTFVVTGVTWACLDPAPAEVESGAISVIFPEGCPLLPPEGGIRSFAFTVGPLAAGDYELRAFRGPGPRQVVTRSLHVFEAEGCVPSATALCLNDARFRVTVTWEDFTDGQGDGQAVPLAGRDDTGVFWFFNEENVELTVKVLNGCGVNNRFWVFIAPGSTVDYTITVTDTRTDQTRVYRNQLGTTPELIPDTNAFATCP